MYIRISKFITLSEKFIKEFRNNLDWDLILECQELSENFIKEFLHEINWEFISECQKLSEDFISKGVVKGEARWARFTPESFWPTPE
jgi:hypothetical protein